MIFHKDDAQRAGNSNHRDMSVQLPGMLTHQQWHGSGEAAMAAYTQRYGPRPVWATWIHVLGRDPKNARTGNYAITPSRHADMQRDAHDPRAHVRDWRAP